MEYTNAIENRYGMIYKVVKFNDDSSAEVCIGTDKNIAISGELKGKTNTALSL